MKKTKLGEFEELVLLTVLALREEAYGVAIKRELEERLKEILSVGSVQSALKRMEEKGIFKRHFIASGTNKKKMIIKCKSCSKQFYVKDIDIPTKGRMVKCSFCSVTWRQMPTRI